jgi:hypothetical protein
MITITDTITISIITITIITISHCPNAHTYAYNPGEQAADSAGKSESEIFSPQDPIVYNSY